MMAGISYKGLRTAERQTGVSELATEQPVVDEITSSSTPILRLRVDRGTRMVRLVSDDKEIQDDDNSPYQPSKHSPPIVSDNALSCSPATTASSPPSPPVISKPSSILKPPILSLASAISNPPVLSLSTSSSRTPTALDGLHIPSNFILRNKQISSKTERRENADNQSDEVLHRSNSGRVTWGEKNCKTDVWREKWIENGKQTDLNESIDDDTKSLPQDDSTITGWSSGTNAKLKQRWKQRWKPVDKYRLNVHKHVQVVDDGDESSTAARTNSEIHKAIESSENLVEEWKEDVEIDTEQKSERSLKFGNNFRQGRAWMESIYKNDEVDDEHTCEKCLSFKDILKVSVQEEVEDHGSHDFLKIHKNSDIDESGVSYRKCFEEVESHWHRGEKVTICKNGIEKHERWFEYDNKETGRRELWTEVWIVEQETNYGFRKGINARGEEWNEKWRTDKSTGEYTIDKWSTDAIGNVHWGEKSGQSIEGEIFGERWLNMDASSKDCANSDLIVNEDGVGICLVKKRVHDKWWEQGTKKWGEKCEESIYTPANETDENVKSVSHCKSVENKEKWYDDSQEKCFDKWTIKMYVEDASEQDPEVCLKDIIEVPIEANASLKLSESCKEQLVKKIRYGEKGGKSHVDDKVWGEKWYELQEPTTNEVLTEKSNPDESDDKLCNRPDSSLIHECSNFNITRRHEEKWWIEPHSNSWGHNYDFYPNQVCRHEKWYDNGTERLTDRWYESLDKRRKWGDKEGYNTSDGVEWKEIWDVNDDSNYEHFEKMWKKTDGDKKYEWGEKSGNYFSNRWTEFWGRHEENSNNSIHQWTNKWTDDGVGNTKVEEETKTENSGNVTDWSLNRYGECNSKSEKWSHKSGFNPCGDKWMEKWNETPKHKFAEKCGSNEKGDKWHESWDEEMTNAGLQKQASKWAKDPSGREWSESWEESAKKKTARKTCWTERGDNWEEQWSEYFDDDGSGEKWSTKWASDVHGNKWGSSSGNKYFDDGRKHHWGETWNKDDVHKWWGNEHD